MEQETQRTITCFGCSGWMNSQSLPLIADAKAMIIRAQVSWLPIVVSPFKRRDSCSRLRETSFDLTPSLSSLFYLNFSIPIFELSLFTLFCVFDF